MKKYLLFIVEGNNDKKEIQAMLRATCGSDFSKKYVDAYHVHGGDITTENDTSDKTIIKKLNDIVLSWRNGGEQPYYKISTSDVEKIVHIVDTDGVFIPDYAIEQSEDGKALYMEHAIKYFDRDRLVGRNRKKAKVLRKLIETKQIDNIPYEIYYVSCNMDHFLFNVRNPLPNEKNRGASEFVTVCDEKFLKDNVLTKEVCTGGSYIESWNEIQRDYNSLGRATNINIFIDQLLYTCLA